METTPASTAFAGSGLSPAKRLMVKLETEEDHLLPNKRSRMEKCCMGTNMVSFQQPRHNLLDQPSPLGLRLKKSPSLLDLIHSRLSQEGVAANLVVDGFGNLGPIRNEDVKDAACESLNSLRTSSVHEKMKASNFTASLLKIGSWECISRYEGDLVAKCYFAKHKLVWEVLDGGLKNKMEIQWSDITALKASFPENGPSNLDIVLARHPLFYRETNPQPRKHTLWQATSDFTGGQATLHRRHFLQVPHGMLNKHFEKLIQCDPRLNLLSQREDTTLESPYFDPTDTVFEEQDRLGCHGNLHSDYFSSPHDSPSMKIPHTSHFSNELEEPVRRLHKPQPTCENPSPSSGKIEEQGRNKNLAPKGSILSEQFIHHIEDCITAWMSSSNSIVYEEGPRNNDILGEITRVLLSNSQDPLASDERRLAPRANSPNSLLHKDGNPNPTTRKDGEHSGNGERATGGNPSEASDDTVSPLGGYERFEELSPSSMDELDGASGSKQGSAMSRKDSFGELLMNGLHRIASLPQLY